MAYSAASFAAGGGDHATVRLRPAALAWYRALSAACSKASNPGMPTLAAANPTLAVTLKWTSCALNALAATFRRTRSATILA